MDERSEVNPDHNKRTADHTKKQKQQKHRQVFNDFLQKFQVTVPPTGHITAYLKIFHKKKLQIS